MAIKLSGPEKMAIKIWAAYARRFSIGVCGHITCCEELRPDHPESSKSLIIKEIFMSNANTPCGYVFAQRVILSSGVILVVICYTEDQKIFSLSNVLIFSKDPSEDPVECNASYIEHVWKTGSMTIEI